MIDSTRHARFLHRLTRACNGYQKIIEAILKQQTTHPPTWFRLLLRTRFRASRLYLCFTESAYLAPTLRRCNDHGTAGEGNIATSQIQDSCREQMRCVFNRYFPWSAFSLDDAFSELTGLKTQQDYIGQLTLHLPEIYGETFRLAAIASTLLDSKSGGIEELLAGLEHVGRNHISFVQQALDSLCQDANWTK